jgi:hypothetical protein
MSETITPNETVESEVIAPRPRYVDAAPANELNAQGELVGIPAEYDETKHKKPRGKDFADSADYLEFNAIQDELRAEELLAKAAESRKKADQIRKMGDPEQRKKMSKFQKALDNVMKFKEELAQLTGEDVDIAELLKGRE